MWKPEGMTEQELEDAREAMRRREARLQRIVSVPPDGQTDYSLVLDDIEDGDPDELATDPMNEYLGAPAPLNPSGPGSPAGTGTTSPPSPSIVVGQTRDRIRSVLCLFAAHGCLDCLTVPVISSASRGVGTGERMLMLSWAVGPRWLPSILERSRGLGSSDEIRFELTIPLGVLGDTSENT